MLDTTLADFIDWEVKGVMRIKNGYGYRVFLRYMDGSERLQQKSGFATQKEAQKAREITVSELHAGTYVVYSNVTMEEFMQFWLQEDVGKRLDAEGSYSTFSYNVKNHIIPALGKKKMKDINKGDIQKLYNEKAAQSVSVAKMCKTVLNIAFRFAVQKKFVNVNPTIGTTLPKKVKKQKYHTRNIDSARTLTKEQIDLLIEKSKDTPIHMMVLFNVLMGLRRSEIIGVKYSDIDYIERTLKIERQLGRRMNSKKEDFAPKTFTKQEIDPKTMSSRRTLPIPDYVFEAILKERERYEKNRNRRKREFQDLDYICCSTYGRPRSKGFHWKYYKQLLKDCGLPDIRWHDLRSTYCTFLLKNDFNPKAVSKLMGHAKEIITVDVYGDKRNIIEDVVPEITDYINDVLPNTRTSQELAEEMLEIVPDVGPYLM